MDDPDSFSGSEEESQNDFNINPMEEKEIWRKEITNNYAYPPVICPSCYHNSFRIYERKKINLINPFYCQCNRKQCKYRKNLRQYSFFKLHNRIPASIILYIFNAFIILHQNATQIHKVVSNKFKNSISYNNTITKILSNIRCCIADYMKNKYRNHMIGGNPDTGKIIALDEALFLHNDQGDQIWVVGAKETSSNKLRIDVMSIRNSSNLEIFVKNHVKAGTTIVTDGWDGYSFLESDNSVWPHEIYNHEAGNFGLGSHSTSHIEITW